MHHTAHQKGGLNKKSSFLIFDYFFDKFRLIFRGLAIKNYLSTEPKSSMWNIFLGNVDK